MSFFSIVVFLSICLDTRTQWLHVEANEITLAHKLHATFNYWPISRFQRYFRYTSYYYTNMSRTYLCQLRTAARSELLTHSTFNYLTSIPSTLPTKRKRISITLRVFTLCVTKAISSTRAETSSFMGLAVDDLLSAVFQSTILTTTLCYVLLCAIEASEKHMNYNNIHMHVHHEWNRLNGCGNTYYIAVKMCRSSGSIDSRGLSNVFSFESGVNYSEKLDETLNRIYCESCYWWLNAYYDTALQIWNPMRPCTELGLCQRPHSKWFVITFFEHTSNVRLRMAHRPKVICVKVWVCYMRSAQWRNVRFWESEHV